MVAEGDWLGNLQVRKPRHDSTRVTFSRIQQMFENDSLFGNDLIDLITGPKAHIRRDLVVSRTAGMELFPGLTDEFDQACFDVHVHIFEDDRPFEIPGLNFLTNFLQSVGNDVAFCIS